MRSKLLLAGALTLALAAPAAAQNNTGGSGWTVSIYDVLGNAWSYNQAVYSPGGQPSVWQPEVGAEWITAWDGDFSADNGVGDYVFSDDTNARYHYFYRYTFDNALTAGSLGFSAGWDNILKGFQFDGGSPIAPVTSSSTPRGIDDHFGFCRDGDGMWNTDHYPVCTADFSVTKLAGANWMEFEVWGDGQTDGLWVQWDVSAGQQSTDVVPEPATMTLLASGLAGMAAASKRRRRKA